ncbi:MAG: AAC(3) family N-acetyltransferase [Candidatus Hydrogenedentes bacterium]|nr:AAC(3) family N-acetyltransferase [Candidatus Hydrogenedentota bacterium]
MIGVDDIREGARTLGLAGRPICVHSSYRSFGGVEGGPLAVVTGLLAEGCTVMVPAFASFFVSPPIDARFRPPRNGWSYDSPPELGRHEGRVYTPDTTEIDTDEMGAIPTAVVNMPARARGNHPLCSFAAVGSLAQRLIAPQAPLNVYAPLDALVAENGAVLLMGVDFTNMTLFHLAEKAAGRTLFRRWAKGPDGTPMMVEAGGCSGGFGAFGSALNDLVRETHVGASRWWALPARETLTRAAEAIRSNPMVTHCGRNACDRCNDAVAGGPILTG